jgi:hypothetical protein
MTSKFPHAKRDFQGVYDGSGEYKYNRTTWPGEKALLRSNFFITLSVAGILFAGPSSLWVLYGFVRDQVFVEV